MAYDITCQTHTHTYMHIKVFETMQRKKKKLYLNGLSTIKWTHFFFFFFPVETSVTKDVNKVFLRVGIFLDDSDMIVYKEMCSTKR